MSSSYKNEHIDHIFYRMRESLPKSENFYIIIIIIKILPMFFQLNTLGYSELNDESSSLHIYFRYLSMCFYIQNSIDINNVIVLAAMFLLINIFLVGLLIYYLSKSKKIKKIDENYGAQNSLNCYFTFFSIFSFFKYVLFNQFFHEINFMPLICTGALDLNKLNKNSIISVEVTTTYLDNVCTGTKLNQFIIVSVFNFILDISMNYLLLSRFFDYNILSSFFWNCAPNIFYSILYLEGFFQVFFIMFLNYDNHTYRLCIAFYYFFLLFAYLIRLLFKNEFYTIKTKGAYKVIEFIRIMCFFGFAITSIFYFFLKQFPSDFIVISLIGIEICITVVLFNFFHRNDAGYCSAIISSTNLNSLNNSNLTYVLCYLITEFKIFSDVNLKFDDSRLDVFLNNYVEHLKNCDDKNCSCKNMTKKVKDNGSNINLNNITRSNININSNINLTNNNLIVNNNNNNNIGTNIGTNIQMSNINTTNTPNAANPSNNSHIQTNNNVTGSVIGGTNLNFYQIKNQTKSDYIINRFFNNIASNLSTTIKQTNNNININSIKDSDKQKVVYNLRLRLINAVKKLISYRLENFYKNVENSYSQNLSSKIKHFIRINFFSLNLLCNKAYYKTIFMYHEYLSEYFRKNKLKYKSNLILYFYLKKCGVNDYNDFLNVLKANKKENSSLNLDFRQVLGNCTKFYDIERKILQTIQKFSSFIAYFEQETVYFDMLLKTVKKFRSSYKSLTDYIRYFFKNDKINNLYVTSKIILFFKILQFDIPDSLHNKLVIQNYEIDEAQNSSKYVDTNYFLIANYVNGDFIINFVSHELLILLEYSESDLKNQDFNILMPEKLREVHKEHIVNQIKNKNNHTIQYKEIFLVSKKRSSILFDFHFKIMLNLKGDITFLCVFNLKKPKKEYRTGFICVDSFGEILAINKEYEDFMVLSMKVLDYIKIDTDKVILQGLLAKMEHFYKDEENFNAEFYDRFEYDKYIYTLFGEEFESLKDKNESLYAKKLDKYARLREIVRKSRCNNYFDVYAKYRPIDNLKLFFIKIYIKLNLTNGKSIENYNSANNLINSIKISKREIAKLSTIKPDESQDEINNNAHQDDNISESRDFLNESQSILSSAAMILKSTNKKRLFRQSNKGFKISPKSRNIVLLSFFLGFFTVCSLILNIIFISIIINLVNVSRDIYRLNSVSIMMQNHITYVTTGILNIKLIENDLFPFEYQDYLIKNELTTFELNTEKFLSNRIQEITDVYYKINYFNNLYFKNDINKKIEEVNNNFLFLFQNGLIFKKDDNSISTFIEISTIQSKVAEILDNYHLYQNITNKLNLDSNSLSNIEKDKYKKGILILIILFN